MLSSKVMMWSNASVLAPIRNLHQRADLQRLLPYGLARRQLDQQHIVHQAKNVARSARAPRLQVHRPQRVSFGSLPRWRSLVGLTSVKTVMDEQPSNAAIFSLYRVSCWPTDAVLRGGVFDQIGNWHGVHAVRHRYLPFD